MVLLKLTTSPTFQMYKATTITKEMWKQMILRINEVNEKYNK